MRIISWSSDPTFSVSSTWVPSQSSGRCSGTSSNQRGLISWRAMISGQPTCSSRYRQRISTRAGALQRSVSSAQPEMGGGSPCNTLMVATSTVARGSGAVVVVVVVEVVVVEVV
ncbi:MAG: hypothetical protein GWN79_21335, partial [Actinobacteria bacterium]|nr:hypothetical protein [Actinomycetota bacterium]NIT97808.1 hypothetical protein [Actinomycetota bacterium]NIU21453.1 hypothetical protein [Actinomycetota bacterium]NIU69630.1 hypothetical protein [Actinomycetota bacterium]NIV57997.1 hypothetical protein [Actinomycetota bacterium]